MKAPIAAFTPVVLLVIGFLLGLTLDKLYPTPLKPLSWLLVVLGLAIALWALVTLLLAKTPLFGCKEATKLVTKGPYRFSRNPMYLGFALFYLGLALWLSSPFAIVMLPVSLYCLWLFVIRKEEKHLKEQFKADYQNYCAKVRRWY
ncbi:methyltransferase family protein [Gallaecimonas mangrovi]|uniref:methyltransferase family protein n=1 Tax=Gallaecimonas mangrovi TaxID=2291597 RepID=UPI000E203036|nr:isoprenylcysteine carboxylmethyltransferase family protein [Gallaecimonas mangrovi]